MLNIIFYVSYLIFSLTDLIPLIKEKKTKDIIAFCFLTVLVYLLAFYYFKDELRDSFIYTFFKIIGYEY